MINKNKWDRSLGTSKREQGVETTSRQVVKKTKRQKLRLFIERILRARQRGHEIKARDINLSEIDELSRRKLREYKTAIKKGRVNIIDDYEKEDDEG